MVCLFVLTFVVPVYYTISIPKMLKVFAVFWVSQTVSEHPRGQFHWGTIAVYTNNNNSNSKNGKKSNNITIIKPEEIWFDYQNESKPSDVHPNPYPYGGTRRGEVDETPPRSFWYVTVFRNDFTFTGKPLIFLTRWGIFYGWWRCWRPVTHQQWSPSSPPSWILPRIRNR